jgi:hypothetical protein
MIFDRYLLGITGKKMKKMKKRKKFPYYASSKVRPSEWGVP